MPSDFNVEYSNRGRALPEEERRRKCQWKTVLMPEERFLPSRQFEQFLFPTVNLR